MEEKIDFFDGIKNHFEEIQIKIIEVPEWGLVGDKAIYSKPFNMLEKSKLFKGANSGDLNILIDVIIAKALTKDHEKMFSDADKLKFKTKADTDIIARVSNAILGADNEEDIKKN
tara:strand:+ start:171 stop:515 length:345 start_codon:yes stop_codon:yes gene_type:complete